LTRAYFQGNAPYIELDEGESVFYNCASGFTVCYTAESTGFTNPWYGYPAKVCSPTIEQPIKVSVDIKPGSCPNPIGFADNKGVMPFAIMGTTDNFEFDITQIDPSSIRITREGVDAEVAPIRWNYQDMATSCKEDETCECDELKSDGCKALSMKVYKHDLVYNLKLQEVAGQTVELVITGKLKDEFGSTPITGKDCIKVLKTVLIVK
jgi:hypothetical protein